MNLISIWNDDQDMEEKIINKENQDKNVWDDDTTDFPVQIGMLDNAKTRWEKDSFSRNELTTENKKQWH